MPIVAIYLDTALSSGSETGIGGVRMDKGENSR